MNDRKLLLITYVSYLFVFLIIAICGITGVFAATYDTFDVTWYYRNKSNENNLLNVVKNQDTPLYASTSEYVNGYTTRLEETFKKDIQYIINYNLQLYFSPEQELNYRSDTLDRIINYSFVDSDFKILNVTATENWNRSSSTGDTALTIKISMQVLALNNTNAIRFGVYTTDNISIGFYNHTDQIDYYLVDNISIEENANAVIIDQNNQIIQGQDELKNNITNSTDIIVENQNANFEELNKTIENQFKTCNYNKISSMEWEQGYYYQSDGKKYNSVNTVRIKNLINVLSGKNYNFRFNPYYVYTFTFYNDGIFVSGYLYRTDGQGVISIPENVNQIGISLFNNNNTPLYINDLNKDNFFFGSSDDCKNKMDETNDKLNDIQGSINDSNIDGSLNNAGSFFDNFTTTDHGGLSGIITAPLVAINQMLNKSCSPMTTNFKGKEISLPCGYEFWAKLGGIQDFLNLVLGGLLCYQIIVKLYKLIEKIKNPEDDRVEVMKL